MDDCVVLSNYPLSKPYRARLDAAAGGTPQYRVLSEMRQAGLASVLRRLMATRTPRLYVACEDPSSLALVPIMQLLAAFVRAGEFWLVNDQLDVTRFGRGAALAAGLRLVVESFRCIAQVGIARLELGALRRSERIAGRLEASRRVAYLNCNLWFGVKAGGSVGHISGVVNALTGLGYGVSFFTVGGRLMVNDEAEVVALTPPRTLAMPMEAAYFAFGRSATAQISARLERERPAFLYQRLSLENYSGVVISRRLGIPLVIEYNGSEAWVAKHWGRPLRFHNLAVLAEEMCLKHAHLIVVVSEVLAQELEGRGVERSRIVVYPNCIDPQMFDPARYTAATSSAVRHDLGFADDDLVATFIGTFGQWHGVDVLSLAIRKLVLEHRADLDRLRLKFLLVGDGVKMSIVRENLAGIDSDRYVRLTGLVPQADAPKYLTASNLLLSPHVANADGTAFFGSPTKLFEYMAMGRGIVASDLDQIGEVLRPAIEMRSGVPVRHADPDCELALLVTPGNVDELVSGILYLAANTALADLLGANARRTALARYTWRHHTQAILDGLDRVMGKTVA